MPPGTERTLVRSTSYIIIIMFVLRGFAVFISLTSNFREKTSSQLLLLESKNFHGKFELCNSD